MKVTNERYLLLTVYPDIDLDGSHVDEVVGVGPTPLKAADDAAMKRGRVLKRNLTKLSAADLIRPEMRAYAELSDTLLGPNRTTAVDTFLEDFRSPANRSDMGLILIDLQELKPVNITEAFPGGWDL